MSTASAPVAHGVLGLHAQSEDFYALASSYESSSDGAATASGDAGNEEDDDGSLASAASSEARSLDDNISQESEVVLEDDTAKEAIQSTLEFHIPKQVFDKAKNAAPDGPESFWSYKLYVGPDERKVKVHYCRSKHTTERVLQTYFADKDILGFDIEWQKDANRFSGIRRNVSLIQIACEDRIALFHLALFAANSKDTAADFVSPSLRRIMESPNVTKTGVSIKADCTRLRTFLDIEVQGIFELSHLYKLVKYSASGNTSNINKRLVALATQVEELLELPLYKGDSVRGSDWSLPLNIEQISYAASDSYAGYMLYQTLEAKRKQLDPIPPRPFHAERNLPIRLASGAMIPTVDEGTDDPVSPNATRNGKYARQSTPIERDINIEQDSDSIPTSSDIPLPKNPLLVAAESWAADYRAEHPMRAPSHPSRPPASCPHSALRAYALWHHNLELSVAAVAAILRDPPLQTSTVTNYILEAVRVEKLPADRERLRGVMEPLPESVREGRRYGRMWKAISAGGQEGQGVTGDE